MATTVPSTTTSGTLGLQLDKIYVPGNVREIDLDHVDALAGSIALQGQLVPIIVTPAEGTIAEQGFEYVLTAGFHRYAAVAKLQYAVIDAVLRVEESDSAQVAAARATENIARKQLNAHEEALAVQAMLDRNLTEDGAAQALGWPKVRVTARVKLLELPVAAQKLIGEGVIPLACVDTLRAVGKISSPTLEAIVDFIANEADREEVVERLQSDTGWVIGHVLTESDSKVFAAYLSYLHPDEVEQLRLGKKAQAQLVEIEQLHKQINPYAYGPPRIRFGEQEVDQARAAGVLIEGEGVPVIVDRPLYRELAKQVLKRTTEDLREEAARVAERRKAQQSIDLTSGGKPQTVDRAAELKRDHGRQMRQFAAQARGVNLDLGWALRNGLSTVDPADINVARFFVYAVLGSEYHSGYGKLGATVRELAVSGIRLVLEEFRTDVTKIKKDGSKGVLRIDYGDQYKPEEPITWMWKFIDRARTAGELYGRALVAIAAERYASRLVLPVSQQQHPLSWASHDGKALKALEKLAGPHLPTSLKQLEKAIGEAKADYDKQLEAVEQAQRSTTVQQDRRPPAADAIGDGAGDGAEAADVEAAGDEFESEEVDERYAEAA